MWSKSEHLKALGFELAVDVFTVFVLILAYKYTFDTLVHEEPETNMNFIRNAFVFLAPGSIEGFRVMVSESRKNVKWDTIELILSVLSILIAGGLMLQCILGYDMLADLYLILIAIYPLRVVMNIIFNFFYILKERR